ncbi:hypothetical protein IFT68_21725 [Oxalobacteraceae sp. CFBP 13730]|nr:hypothetical protein [Oxalobacteraceae sp. CFBP 13730]
MRTANEDASAAALDQALARLHVNSDDFFAWHSLNVGLWQEGKPAPLPLRKIVKTVLEGADPINGARLALKYFDLHTKLMTAHAMSHEEARSFLTNAFLIADLATVDLLSAAQIARLLSEGREGSLFSRQSVGSLLLALRCGCALEETKVKALFDKDRVNELSFFADAGLEAAAEIVNDTAMRLGNRAPLAAYLLTLARFTPYLQILHFQCVIAEFYDHATTDVYEFNPRSKLGKWIFDQYPLGKGNPFLNNLKSVEVLAQSWVRAKKSKERPGAHVLLGVLQGLQEMRFAGRRELAKAIRLWLHRVIRLSKEQAVSIPAALSADQHSRINAWVATGNTVTCGVVEQRIVDAVSTSLHLKGDFRIRGRGDSVNTTNISRKKMGDCDFQNSDDLIIHAYESHGGTLTDIYVDEHIRTLEKVIGLRKDELEGVADISKWKLNVIFIAHNFSLKHRGTVTVGGLNVSFDFIDFSVFLSRAPSSIDWGTYLIAPLNERRTANEVREKFLAAANAVN